jgi:hypothetical protein
MRLRHPHQGPVPWADEFVHAFGRLPGMGEHHLSND